jgi:hypothetical protein
LWRKVHPQYDNAEYPSPCGKVNPYPTNLTNSKAGEKCRYAHDWGIDVVNHLWLEETYAKWQVQSVTVPRYTYFPPQTNLTEILDKTEIQDEGIINFYAPEEDEEMTDVQGDNDEEIAKSDAQNVQSSYMPPDIKTPAPKELTKGLPPRTPAMDSTRSETGTPISTKRRAAENAITKLHNEIMPDVLLWQKEKNRKRIPEEQLSPSIEEKKRKAEKRKNEEKENIVETVPKKSRKQAEKAKDESEPGAKVTAIITGASDELTTANSLKVCS